MLDLKFIRENIEAVRQNCAHRNIKVDLDSFEALDHGRRTQIQNLEEIRRLQNETAQAMKEKLDKARRDELVAQGKELKERAQKAEEILYATQKQLDLIARQIPNMTHPDVPVGATEENNRELRRWGKPTEFDFPPLDHIEIGQKLDLIDFETGAKVSGQKFYYLKNEAVLLEQALINYALHTLRAQGFVPIMTPDLARAQTAPSLTSSSSPRP